MKRSTQTRSCALEKQPKRYQKGFTLIELVIAIAIVAILTAIAIPSYQEQVRKSKRKAAATCLTEYAQFMERYYTTNLTYVDADPGTLGCANDLASSYTFDLTDTPTLSEYSITATAEGTQLDDEKCLDLSIDHTGARAVSGSNSGTPTDCWSK